LVLTIHMAALAAVDGRLHGENPLDDLAGVSAYLLRRERHAWSSLPTSLAGQPRTSATLFGRTVFTAILTGPLPYRDGVRALMRLQIASSLESAAAVLDDHQLLYPPHDSGTVLEPLYPDRLAEDFLALSTPSAGQSAGLVDPWTYDAPQVLLDRQGDGAPADPWDRPAITVLIAASQRWPHVAVQHLYPLLRTRPGLAIVAGSAALTSLAALPGLDPEVLRAVEPEFPASPDVELDLVAATWTQRLVDCRLSALSEPAERARLLADLGCRYANAGMHEQAVASTQEAADLYRELAKNNRGDNVHGDLGKVLGNLAFFLAEVGRENEALTSAQEAVALLQQLAEADPRHTCRS
jgi:tetratricopeptide (TPR) repeat protein